MLRRLSVICIALGLAACAPGYVEVGEWKVQRTADRIAETPQATAALVTRTRNRRVEADQPFAPQFVQMNLLCFEKRPVVRLEFDYDVGSNRNSRVGYRFDQNPGRDVKARVLRKDKVVMIEDTEEVFRFIEEMKTAKTLILQVFSLDEGITDAEFKVGSAPTVINTVFAGCPFPANINRRADARERRGNLDA